MSLNRRQVAATRNELGTNLALSGQSMADIATTLGRSESEVRAALDVDGQPRDDDHLSAGRKADRAYRVRYGPGHPECDHAPFGAHAQRIDVLALAR
ncbi:DUF2316 family protein [Cryobacterium sp. Y11]|uniref:DUF2316 family protein n=1 Tax=Cryobacterium sp. Y11 TaxID=2045016 RepID=UPI000CE52D69|nr:DUF2316 family protein [Cryobacterium sp. Y11]